MAVALLATLYGLILGSVIYGPIGEKIRVYAERLKERDVMILQTLLLIKDRKTEQHISQTVSSYSRHRKKSTKAAS